MYRPLGGQPPAVSGPGACPAPEAARASSDKGASTATARPIMTPEARSTSSTGAPAARRSRHLCSCPCDVSQAALALGEGATAAAAAAAGAAGAGGAPAPAPAAAAGACPVTRRRDGARRRCQDRRRRSSSRRYRPRCHRRCCARRHRWGRPPQVVRCRCCMRQCPAPRAAPVATRKDERTDQRQSSRGRPLPHWQRHNAKKPRAPMRIAPTCMQRHTPWCTWGCMHRRTHSAGRAASKPAGQGSRRCCRQPVVLQLDPPPIPSSLLGCGCSPSFLCQQRCAPPAVAQGM
jgi:hypothetical protein